MQENHESAPDPEDFFADMVVGRVFPWQIAQEIEETFVTAGAVLPVVYECYKRDEGLIIGVRPPDNWTPDLASMDSLAKRVLKMPEMARTPIHAVAYQLPVDQGKIEVWHYCELTPLGHVIRDSKTLKDH